jgi:hypothetical protein
MTNIAAIDWGALGKVIWVSLVAGVGLTAIVCLTLIGSIRASEARASGRHSAAVAYGILGAVGLAGVLAALVFGLIVMTSK